MSTAPEHEKAQRRRQAVEGFLALVRAAGPPPSGFLAAGPAKLRRRTPPLLRDIADGKVTVPPLPGSVLAMRRRTK